MSSAAFKLEAVLTKQSVIWWSTSSARTAQGGVEGEMSSFTSCLHQALQNNAMNKKELTMMPSLPGQGPSDEKYCSGIDTIKNAVKFKFTERNLKGLEQDFDPENVQEPQINDNGAREAFTFALPPAERWPSPPHHTIEN
jgi:hypothetical protein